MRAGLLTEKIEIHAPVIVKTDTGYEETVYEPSVSCRAYVQYSSGARTEENSEIVFNRTVIFQIRRFYTSVTELFRIKWNNKFYRIISIEPHKKEQYIGIVTELIND